MFHLKTVTCVVFLWGWFFLWTNNTEARPTSILDLNVSVSHRVDQLRWNIAGLSPSGNNVNVLSELSWKDLSIVQAGVGGRLIVDDSRSPFSFYSRGALGLGKIYRGDNQDSDYDQKNRTAEFSRSNNSADDGDVLDVTFGMGPRFRKSLGRPGITMWLSPLVGYSYHEQNLVMTDGVQTVPLLGPFSGLNSTYDTEWRGPWVGLDVSLEMDAIHTVFGSIEYHWASYEGRANWNLRPEFAHPLSFLHEANGTGITASLGLEEHLIQDWTFIVKIDYLDWRTDAGIDYVFFSDGGIARTPLNEVRWESYALTFEFRHAFQ